MFPKTEKAAPCLRRCFLKKGNEATGSAGINSPSDYSEVEVASSVLPMKKAVPCFRYCFLGAGDEARTRYLHLGKVALYQMSYARIWPERYALRRLVDDTGLEPVTSRTSSGCSYQLS